MSHVRCFLNLNGLITRGIIGITRIFRILIRRESVLMKEKEELTNTLNEYKRKNEELSNENRSKFESLAATEDRLKKIELTLKSEEEYSKKRESFSVTLQEKCSLLECQNNE